MAETRKQIRRMAVLGITVSLLTVIHLSGCNTETNVVSCTYTKTGSEKFSDRTVFYAEIAVSNLTDNTVSYLASDFTITQNQNTTNAYKFLTGTRYVSENSEGYIIKTTEPVALGIKTIPARSTDTLKLIVDPTGYINGIYYKGTKL